MGNSNQELMQRLDKIQVDETNMSTRTANRKILEHLCGDDYQAKGLDNIDRFIQRANDPKGNFHQLAHQIAEMDTAGNSAIKLRHVARHKLQLLNIDRSINQIDGNSSAKKADIEHLQAIILLKDQDSAKREKHGGEVFKDFENFQYKKYAPAIDALVTSAESKLKAIHDSKKEKQQERRDKIGVATKAHQALAAKEEDEGSIKHLQQQFAAKGIFDKLSSARIKIENQLRGNKDNYSQFTHLGYVRHAVWGLPFSDKAKTRLQRRQTIAQLQKEREALEKQMPIVISAEALMQQTLERLTVHQQQLDQLNDELNLKKIQSREADYQVELIADPPASFPSDEAIRLGYVYCQKNATNPDTFDVKVRSLTDKKTVVTQSFQMADLIPAAVSATSSPSVPTVLEGNHKDPIIHLLRQKKMIYDQYDEFQIDQDLANAKTICLRMEHIEKDIKEATAMLALCEDIAADPLTHQNKIDKRANYLIRVMALSERQDLDEQKKHYFVEEIVSRDEAISPEQPRGLSGYSIYRGIHLNKNEFKRATCETEKGKIVIETSVQIKEGKEIGVVVDRSINPNAFSPEDQQLAAIQFASELLLKHKPGEPITLEGGAECAEQAKLVYAALLLLTEPEVNTKTPPFDPSCIKVNVAGAKTPSWTDKTFSWRENWRKKFAEPLITHADFKKCKEHLTQARQRFTHHSDKIAAETGEAAITVTSEIKIKLPGG